MIEAGKITNPAHALRFILAGNSRTTLVSTATGCRYTYRVKQCEDAPNRFFVSLLSGPDNTSDFVYLGVVDAGANGPLFRTTKATRNPDSAPVKAFQWALQRLIHNELPKTLEVWHEGRCGRCARVLTVPESIATGYGPECASILGL